MEYFTIQRTKDEKIKFGLGGRNFNTTIPITVTFKGKFSPIIKALVMGITMLTLPPLPPPPAPLDEAAVTAAVLQLGGDDVADD
uniref:Uncharacterized protein n=1 Tax=Glossina brevipalpis TaxID=37001 RepID=A0A1A9W4N1_9MUSC